MNFSLIRTNPFTLEETFLLRPYTLTVIAGYGVIIDY